MATTEERLDRLEQALATLNVWLMQAQTGWGMQDVNGIDRILHPSEDGDDG